MKSLFDHQTAETMIARINKLHPGTQPQWGKMNVAQMLAHCRAVLELYCKGRKLKRPFLGILVGGIVKRKMLTEKPWARHLPTASELQFPDGVQFEEEKADLQHWIHQFVQYGAYVSPVPAHPFFGRMSVKDWGHHQYKHLDHHLTQFGV